MQKLYFSKTWKVEGALFGKNKGINMKARGNERQKCGCSYDENSLHA
jgi:hypothetical protein